MKASPKLNKAAAGLAGADLVLLDDAILVLQWGRVPGDADGSAVLVSYRQDRYLLGGSAGSCRREKQDKAGQRIKRTLLCSPGVIKGLGGELQQGRLNLNVQVHSRNCRGTISLLW